MNTTIRTKDIRCQEVLPPVPGYPDAFASALVEIDDGRGHLSMSVDREGLTRARELAALLNAACDAVEAREQEPVEEGRGELFGEHPDGEHDPDPVAESLDRETVEVGG